MAQLVRSPVASTPAQANFTARILATIQPTPDTMSQVREAAGVIDNGGPAFPTERFTSYGNGAGVTTREGGMTLLDWFAGQALTGMMGFATGGTFDPSKNCDRFAEASYALADAMIAARKGGPES